MEKMLKSAKLGTAILCYHYGKVKNKYQKYDSIVKKHYTVF